jgi:uncharacterized protein involved in outer membrane biogenesis
MRTLLKVFLSIVAVIVIPGIGLLVYLTVADLAVHKDYFEKEASAALGHDVSIGGLFDLQIGKKILLTIEDVSASNPEWAEAPEYFSATRIHLLIDTWSLLGDTIEIDTVELSGARLNLRQSTDGPSNWQPNLTEMQTVAIRMDNNDEVALVLHHLGLDDIEMSYEMQGEPAQKVVLQSLQLDRDSAGATRVELAGSYAANTLSLPFTAAGIVHLDDQRIRLSETRLDLDGGMIGLDGWINIDGSGELEVVAEGADLSVLGESFGAGELPGLPYSLTTQLSTRPGQVELSDFLLAIGAGEIAGSLTIELDQDRPHFTANIDSPLLDLATPGEINDVSQDVEEEQIGTERVFGAEPLAYSWLNSANIDAGVSIDSVILADDRLEDLNFRLRLDDGALTIDPFDFSSGDGSVSGKLDLSPTQERHALSLELTLSDLRPGALAIEGQEAGSIPPLNLAIKLSGQGESIREIMSSANGSISGRHGVGQINLQAAGVLFSDLITSILRTLNPLAETDPVTNLECGVYEVEIIDGIATIEQFALQTGRLTIVSSGDIDLSTEEIDLTLRTKTREGLGVSLGGIVNSFLKIGGTLNDPSLAVDAAGSVTTAGAAVATGGLSVLARGLWDRVSAEANICAEPEKPADAAVEQP